VKRTHTPPRSVRVPDDVWQSAKDEAERRGETVTDAIVRFLTRYGKS
jgi:macrodomain Ter protein organizer (MatP/YcbG family)